MNTPIFDFVDAYSHKGVSRFHMPGHKGKSFLGCEAYDITEISGADVLYYADGIIAESQRNAAQIFGAGATYYSTEGSTLCIKAMLKIATDKRAKGERRRIFAARGVHKAFVNACALLDIDVQWIYPSCATHECAASVTAAEVDAALAKADRKPQAVYITSPNYLGVVSDIRAISDTCKRHGVPLIVDNAHGAYLRFLENDMHPITEGAAMCADSAHKTLPVLTGGAYLHISKDYSDYIDGAMDALSLFASTSPSYLTLASLDLCNKYMSEGYRDSLAGLCRRAERLRESIRMCDFSVLEGEPLKIVVSAVDSGYTGYELADLLLKSGVVCEFCDREYLVLMLTPENTSLDFERIESAFLSLEKREPIQILRTALCRPQKAASIREAMLAKSEKVSVSEAYGRILADAAISCPPAVPVVVSGEVIGKDEIELLKTYGVEYVKVVIE